jgi:hypothetical protein
MIASPSMAIDGICCLQNGITVPPQSWILTLKSYLKVAERAGPISLCVNANFRAAILLIQNINVTPVIACN